MDEAKYVFRNYDILMTRQEKLAFRHLSATIKAADGRSDVPAQTEVKGPSGLYRKLLSHDPEVLLLVHDGYDAFVLRTGQRILDDNRHRIFLNYCPECHKLARTPRAKQCRFCRHDWHE